MPPRTPFDDLSLEVLARLPQHHRDRAKQLLIRRAQLTGTPIPAKPWPADTPIEMLRMIAPTFVTNELAPHHEEFWEHVMAIEPGVRPDPLVFVVNRGGAKSASAEMAAVALGGTRRRRYCLYVCHESGTSIMDRNHSAEWITVDDHPTARERRGPGFEVKLAGLPFTEVVTPEHQWWARRVARRDRGHGRGSDIRVGRPHWIEAQDLDWNTWIGYPIDQTVIDPTEHFKLAVKVRAPGSHQWHDEMRHFAPFDDPEWWWLIGLWWGDGTLGGANGAQISFAMADAHPQLVERLAAVLEKHGYKWGWRQTAGACRDVYFCDSVFGRWLKTWKEGRNRKRPPSWVEQLDHEKQAALLRGYFDADGGTDDRFASLTSIHLPGLLSVRRMAMRLGVPTQIVKKRAARKGGFSYKGRTYDVAQSYMLRIGENGAPLGFDDIGEGREKVRDLFIDDGFLWSRVKELDAVEDRTFVAITTKDHTYVTAYGLSHNCGTQEQADDHVQSVAEVLESPQLAEVWPDMAERKLSKHGHSRGWRRNRLRTKAGFTIDAIGLVDSARGARLEEQRPDLIILDDVDAAADSPLVVQKKLLAIRDAIIPAGSPDAATFFVQNVIHDNSICRRLVEPDAFPAEERLLLSRKLIGPIPAVWDLAYEQVELEDGTFRWKITSGRPSWSRLPLERCEQILNDVGSRAFEVEYQHSTEPEPGGIFSHLRFRHMPFDDLPWHDFVDLQVWVDPAVTSKDDSDSCGITASAVDSNGFIYILWWVERIMSPGDALSLAILLGERLGASTIGVESDQGGDTWEVVFRHHLERLEKEGEIEAEWAHQCDFAQDKAGSYGSKVERASQMVPDYEHGFIVHAVNDAQTHLAMERALWRFPKTPPLDGVDSLSWAWRWARRLVPAPALGREFNEFGARPSNWNADKPGADPSYLQGWHLDTTSRPEAPGEFALDMLDMTGGSTLWDEDDYGSGRAPWGEG